MSSGSRTADAKTSGAKVAPKSAKENKNDAGLTPDEFADKLLGIAKEHENDPNFDIEAYKFWLEAAYKNELSDLFKEKNRRRAFIDALLKHGYKEDEINSIFVYAEKERRAKIRYSEEAVERSNRIQQRILRVLIFLFSLFIVTQLFVKSREFEQKRLEQQIYDNKVIKIEMANTPLYKKGPLETAWSIIPLREPIAREGYSLRAEAENKEHKLVIAENVELTIHGIADLEVKNITLDSENEAIVSVTIKLIKGLFSWNVAEGTSAALNLEFDGGSIAIAYGEGKAEMNQDPWRFAIRDGETRLSTGQILSRPFNGMMELHMQEPFEIRMYDHY